MTQTNQKLQTELEILQVEVQQKLDKMEFKEKNDVFENEKQKRQAPLEQLLKVKENELKNSMKIIESYKKEKENLQKQLEEKVDIIQINSLNDQIKIANEKISDMQKEIKYLSKVKEEHNKCAVTQEKIEKEISDIKKQIAELNMQKKERSKMERENNSLSKVFNNSRVIKSQKEKEQEIQNNLNEFWSENKNKLLNSNNDSYYEGEKNSSKKKSNS